MIESGFIIPFSFGVIKETSAFPSFNKYLIGSKTAGCSIVETMICGKAKPKSDFGFVPRMTSSRQIPKIAIFNDSVPEAVKKTSLALQCKIRAILILASSSMFLARSPSVCKEEGLAQKSF